MTKAQLQGKSSTDEKDNSAAKTEKPVEHGPQSQPLPPHLLIKAPRQIKPSEVSSLQQVIGNRAVQRTLAKDQRGAADASTVIQRHRMWVTSMGIDGGTKTTNPTVGHIVYHVEEEKGGE